MTDRQMTEADLAQTVAELNTWSIMYASVNGDGRWVRSKEVISPALDSGTAMGMFWIDRDPTETVRAACLAGDIACVDHFEYADEPDFTSYKELLDRIDAYNLSKEPRQHFTVFYTRPDDKGDLPHSKYVEAVDAIHAELIAREDAWEPAASRPVMVMAVVDLYVPVAENARVYKYGTPDGQPLAPKADPPVETAAAPQGKSNLFIGMLVLAVLVFLIILGSIVF